MLYKYCLMWWCTKIVSELIVHTRANGCTWRTKEKNQSESTDGVPTKDSPKVKLVIEESPRTQERQSRGEFMYLKKVRVCGLYSGGELTWIPWYKGISLKREGSQDNWDHLPTYKRSDCEVGSLVVICK